jgi:hypothetical protein
VQYGRISRLTVIPNAAQPSLAASVAGWKPALRNAPACSSPMAQACFLLCRQSADAPVQNGRKKGVSGVCPNLVSEIVRGNLGPFFMPWCLTALVLPPASSFADPQNAFSGSACGNGRTPLDFHNPLIV